LRVLVVEDDPDTGDSLALLLRLYGHEATVTRDGDAAALACQSFLPDVLLLDLGLPGEDGFRVAGRLLPLLERRPLLVAMTGHGREEHIHRCRQVGFDHYFLKPADLDCLRQVLEEYGTCLARAEGPEGGPRGNRPLSGLPRTNPPFPAIPGSTG
jgi:DNA-binding response OmpR family regulator